MMSYIWTAQLSLLSMCGHFTVGTWLSSFTFHKGSIHSKVVLYMFIYLVCFVPVKVLTFKNRNKWQNIPVYEICNPKKKKKIFVWKLPDTVSNERDFVYMSFFSAISKDSRFPLNAGHIKKKDLCVARWHRRWVWNHNNDIYYKIICSVILFPISESEIPFISPATGETCVTAAEGQFNIAINYNNSKK